MFEYDRNSKVKRTERINYKPAYTLTKSLNIYDERYEDKRRVVKRRKN